MQKARNTTGGQQAPLIMDIVPPARRQSIIDYHPISPRSQIFPKQAINPRPSQAHRPEQPVRQQPTAYRSPSLSLPVAPSAVVPKAPDRKWSKWMAGTSMRDIYTSGFVSLVVILAGLFEPLRTRPYLIVLIYTVLAIVLKMGSKKAFSIALFLLVAAPLLFALGRQNLAEVYATLSFLFIAAGLVISIAELYDRRQQIVR